MPIKNTKAFSLSQNTENSLDPIRENIQSYWVYDGTELVYDKNNAYNSEEKSAQTNFNFNFTKQTFRKESIVFDADTEIETTKFIETLEITPVYLPETERAVGRGSRGGQAVDPEKQFDEYIENSIIPVLGSIRPDYKLDLDAPIEYISEVDNDSVIAGTVNFVYNYGLEIYESEIESGVSEDQLANFYKFSPFRPRLASTSLTFSGAGRERPKLTKDLVSSVLSEASTAVNEIQDFFMNSEGFLEALERNEKRDTFPFYNEVYFTNPPDKLVNDKFKEALRESGLIIAFCDLMNKEDFKLSQQDTSNTIQELSFANSYLSSSYEDTKQTSFRETPAIKTENIKLYDGIEMFKIMQNVTPRVSIGPAAEGKTKVGTKTFREKGYLTDKEQAEYRTDTISGKKAFSTIAIDYENALDDIGLAIDELLSDRNNYRSYKEILAGKKSLYQSDVLFYRIKKYEEGSDTPIQNFWIPAEKGYRGIRYIDTQVKYGKMYRYQVCAYKFVIGSEYEFVEKEADVFNFSELLEQYVEEISSDLSAMVGIGFIRPSYEEIFSNLPAGLPGIAENFRERLINSQTEIAIAEAVDSENIVSSDLVKAGAGSSIDIIAQNVLSGGSFPDSEVTFDMLTEDEKENLNIIRESWECLSNTNGTGFGTLAEIEITARNIQVLGKIQEEIVAGLERRKERNAKLVKWAVGITTAVVLIVASVVTFGTVGAAAAGLAANTAAFSGSIFGASAALITAGQATAVTASAIAALIGTAAASITANAVTAAATSKKNNLTELEIDDLKEKELKEIFAKIAGLGVPELVSGKEQKLVLSGDLYFIDYPTDPVTFKSENVDTPRFNTGLFKFDSEKAELDTSSAVAALASAESVGEYLNEKKKELENIEPLLREQARKLESLIADYAGCYTDFLEAAQSINIVSDYKRINKYTLKVETNQTIKLAELPYYESEGMILDNPPIYPNVNVVTYKGIADRLSFFMNSGQGAIEIEPVAFTEAEEDFITNFRRSKKLNDFQPILYKSDETENLGTTFEIRRLTVPPESYDSFRDAKVETTTRTTTTGLRIPAATFDEIINSNTKYYYIFRVSDRRGVMSYPSGVMEIEIVENSGIIYPLIRPYEFPKQKTDTNKSLKRLLNIVPRITQVLPPSDTESYKALTTGATGILGREDEKLFGKQFKLRLTSKKTGKTVDLNLNFKATVTEASTKAE
jgi:hypothetical protein